MAVPAMVATPYTPEAYLALDRRAEIKSEYLDGEIIAMSGASLSHNLITWNIGGSLRNRLEDSPCTVLGMDMRVQVDRRLYCYPDVAVVCGEPQLADVEQDVLLNPTVIIEVLSPSTEAYDRGEKFKRYRGNPSLRQYVLVSQHTPSVEVYTREGDFWTYRDASGLDAMIRLDAIGCTLPLRDVYAKVPMAQEGRSADDGDG